MSSGEMASGDGVAVEAVAVSAEMEEKLARIARILTFYPNHTGPETVLLTKNRRGLWEHHSTFHPRSSGGNLVGKGGMKKAEMIKRVAGSEEAVRRECLAIAYHTGEDRMWNGDLTITGKNPETVVALAVEICRVNRLSIEERLIIKTQEAKDLLAELEEKEAARSLSESPTKFERVIVESSSEGSSKAPSRSSPSSTSSGESWRSEWETPSRSARREKPTRTAKFTITYGDKPSKPSEPSAAGGGGRSPSGSGGSVAEVLVPSYDVERVEAADLESGNWGDIV